jgi:hypothetical protein
MQFNNLLNGHLFNEDIALEARALLWRVSEAIQCSNSFVEHLTSAGTDPEQFYIRVKSWSLTEQIAVIHMVQNFWNSSKPDFNSQSE